VGAPRRHAGRGADRLLRDPGGDGPHPRGADRRLAVAAGYRPFQGGLLGVFGWNLFHNPSPSSPSSYTSRRRRPRRTRPRSTSPRPESELVSGYNVEYSGIRFGFFFLAEFGDMFIVAALATACFLGGWNVPFFNADTLPWNLGNLLSLGVFLTKAFAMVLIMMWSAGRCPACAWTS